LGGDVAVAGPPPDGGWRIRVGADHARPAPDDPVVTLSDGGLATSSTVCRRWQRGGAATHHIVDPRTGRNPAPCWDAASVAAGSCVDANTATTAAIVLGPAAPRWLAQRGLPARLVSTTGEVTTIASWPGGEPG
jgi:thiamine biosynthesis lipoprotein